MLYSVVYFVVHFSFTLCVRNWFLFCYSVYIFLFLKQCWHFIYVFGFVIACPLHTKVVRCWFSEKENNFIYITGYALIEMKVCTKNVQTQSLLCSIRAFCMLELSQKNTISSHPSTKLKCMGILSKETYWSCNITMTN